MLNPQLDRRGELIHLLTTEGLPRRHVERLLHAAGGFAADAAPSGPASGLPVFLCLPEDAAQEREAYAAAASRLSLRPVALDARAGAALAGTVAALEPGLLVLRHAASGAAHCAAAHAAPGLRIVNAGDGSHADPLPALALVQAMLESRQDLTNLAVALVGDIRHSGAARSVIHAMTTLGVPEVRAAAPRTLLPDGLAQLGVRACASLDEGLRDADVIIVLPLDVERMSGALLPSAREYAHSFGLTPASLAGARSDALLLPAGGLEPGVEVDGDIAASLMPVQARLAELELHLRHAALSVLAGGAP
ncbi:aspartate carbamoyltransferase [Achromobacter denitrificans]